MEIGHYSTCEKAGSGAYAVVRKVELNGKRYAAKQTDPELLYHAKGHPLWLGLRKRSLKECLLLKSLQHPNIVQFIGASVSRKRVTLVMEYLPMNVAECLERCSGFPAPLKYRILRDVSQALLYLHSHSPVIIHRDLSANNIMLTQDLTAKIADFGSSTSVDDLDVDGTASPCPGAMVSMAPEAMTSNPVYDEKLDIFSFGVVSIHVVIEEWPIPPDGPDSQRVDTPDGLEAPELQHLVKYLHRMVDHPLLELVIRCLQFDPQLRPSASEIALEVGETSSHDLPANPQELINVISHHHKAVVPSQGDSESKRKWTQTKMWRHAQGIHLERQKIELEEKQRKVPKPLEIPEVEIRMQLGYPPTAPTMKLLMEELYNEVASKYRAIGILLGLSTSALQDIENLHRGDPKECLLDVFTKWLHLRVDPPATWEEIASALSVVERNDLAIHLRRRYIYTDDEVSGFDL